MSDAAPDPVTCTIEDGVAVVRLDDGKVNVVSHRVIELLHAALDRSLEEATAVAIIGREGKLLGRLRPHRDDGGHRAHAGAGGRRAATCSCASTATRSRWCSASPATRWRPARCCACRATSASVATGPPRSASTRRPSAWASPTTPWSSPRSASRAPTSAAARCRRRSTTPPGAVEAGYLDRVVPAADVERATIDEARRLGQLPGSAYGHTKLALHRALIDRVDPNIDADMASLTAPRRSRRGQERRSSMNGMSDRSSTVASLGLDAAEGLVEGIVGGAGDARPRTPA